MFGLQVMNLGKSLKSYGTAFLNIQWPKESAMGKWLLYLVKITSKGLAQVTCSPESEINPNSLTEVKHPNYSFYSYIFSTCKELYTVNNACLFSALHLINEQACTNTHALINKVYLFTLLIKLNFLKQIFYHIKLIVASYQSVYFIPSFFSALSEVHVL